MSHTTKAQLQAEVEALREAFDLLRIRYNAVLTENNTLKVRTERTVDRAFATFFDKDSAMAYRACCARKVSNRMFTVAPRNVVRNNRVTTTYVVSMH